MNKYYKIIVISIFLIILVISMFLLLNKDDNNQTDDISKITKSDIEFKLLGKEIYELNTNEEYKEPGYIAYLSDGTDLTEFVEVQNDNIIKDGTYKIIYKLKYDDISLLLTREIVIKNNSNNNTIDDIDKNENKVKMILNGAEEVYILKGNKYKENGAYAINSEGKNISENISINGVVNTDIIGEYVIKYSLKYDNMNETLERKIIVYDYKYDFKISRSNDKINLIFSTFDDYVDYVVINGKANKVTLKNETFTLNDNEEYVVKIYDKYGYYKEEKFNFIKPTVKCEAILSDNKTTVNVTNGQSTIKKYYYYFNNKKYESIKNNYSITGTYNNISVEVYDENNNSNKTTCNIIDNVPFFESGLKELKYSNWNYYLYVPKNVKKNQKKSLVVFLHGSGECGSNLKLLDSYGFAKYIKKGNEYDTFILIPQLPSGSWSGETTKIMNLINYIVSEYNIDQNKISISGFSLGAMAIPIILKENPNYFSSTVLVSIGSRGSSYASYFKNTPTWIFAGTEDTKMGYSSTSRSLMNAIEKISNNNIITIYKGKGHNIIDKALEDGSVIKWMISQSKNN